MAHAHPGLPPPPPPLPRHGLPALHCHMHTLTPDLATTTTTTPGLVGEIIKRFEQKGFKLAAMKMQVCSKDHMEEHYKDLAGKGFFAGLVEYMTSGPVVCMVWAGKGVVATGRKMLGATNPADSAPGTIRGDFCVEVGRNICHGSDAVESAEREIALWFPEGVCDWTSSEEAWVYE